MTSVKTIKEVCINIIGGNKYYYNNVVPLLKKEGKKWKNKWNKKKACLILSYDIDETSDIKELPKLLKLLKKHNIKASFAVIGLLAQKNPEIFKKILSEGHELINHTQTHPDSVEFNNTKHFHEITPRERHIEIFDCNKIVK